MYPFGGPKLILITERSARIISLISPHLRCPVQMSGVAADHLGVKLGDQVSMLPDIDYSKRTLGRPTPGSYSPGCNDTPHSLSIIR